jgi:uncharacterized protein with HEPN domain
MKERSPKLFVSDILDCMKKILTYTSGLTFEKFEYDTMVVDAVIRNLEIIGEASRNIPEDLREKYSDISWKNMIGLRNIILHDYFGIDYDTIWKIITVNIPETMPKVERIYKELEK